MSGLRSCLATTLAFGALAGCTSSGVTSASPLDAAPASASSDASIVDAATADAPSDPTSSAPSVDASSPDAAPAMEAGPALETIDLNATATTSATGFPTSWFGFPLPAGATSYAGLTGTVSVTNSADIYSEVLFIVGYLPSGSCTSGLWPASTPEYGPPGFVNLTNLIVKAPTMGSFSVPVDFTLPETAPIASCALIGLNGGTVSSTHAVTSTSTLSLRYEKTPADATVEGIGGEYCFGQDWGCQGATTDDSRSFARVHSITKATTLTALFGDISDSTFDGTSSFGAPPAGAWTAKNDFYVYHGAECGTVTAADAGSGGDFYASIPPDATHLLSVPLSGNGIGVSTRGVFQPLSVPLANGDCIVTLWGLEGGGGFDNETQISALTVP